MASESAKQLKELERQQAAESMPPVVDHGMEVNGDVMRQAKVKDMERRMTTAETKQYHQVRSAKYGYPPVK